MFQIFHHRAGHYLILVSAWALLSLVNLGKPGLWDQDEGLNAEAAREMLHAKDWVVPTFNYKLRTAKPALLYWAQMISYKTFGINEFAARFPSALAALFTILLVYGLTRRMFDPSTGLLAALILASSILFTGSAHFANPDALLHFSVVLAFYIFWQSYSRDGNGWLAWCAIATGLGMMAKGPLGLCLPMAAFGLFLIWMKQIRRWFHPQLIFGVLIFTMIAIPWYVWVTAETRGEFLRQFLLRDHLQRFNSSLESHSGPPFFYLLILCAGLAPWSVFFLFTGIHVWKWRTEQENRSFDPRYRLLFCWMIAVLIPFTIAATKLPNYVLPMYAPIAIMIAHALIRWRRGEYQPPKWVLHLTFATLAVVGCSVISAGLVGGGVLLPELTKGRVLHGLEKVAVVGAFPLLASVLAWWFWKREARAKLLATLGVTAVLFTGGIAAWGMTAVDQHRAIRTLSAKIHQHKGEGEVRVATWHDFQPSMVFYSRRRVQTWFREDEALSFMKYDLQTFLFLSEDRWDQLRAHSDVPLHELGRQYDFERGHHMVLISNRKPIAR